MIPVGMELLLQRFFNSPTNQEEFVMKTFAQGLLFVALGILGGSQVFAQTFGIFADSSAFKKDGYLLGNPLYPIAGMYANGGAVLETVTSADSVKKGTALHVTFHGASSERLIFTVDTTNWDGGTPVNFSQWKKGRLTFWIRLIKPIDLNIEVGGYRIRTQNLNSSDESLAKYHGLNTTDTLDWQRMIVELDKPIDGDLFDFSQFMTFALRSHGNASDFLVDEIYVDYAQRSTYGLYADSAAFKLDGSLGDAKSPTGGIWKKNSGTYSEVTGADSVITGKALLVSLTGTSDDVGFAANPADDNATASFPLWNAGELVFHIKLIHSVDVRLEIQGWRIRTSNINGTDQNLSELGLNIHDTTNWQTIRFDLTQPINKNDQDLFDYSKWAYFALRGTSAAATFLVDEAYVSFPTTGGTGVSENNILPATFSLYQNYPNPFNPSTEIGFTLPQESYTTLRVYNLLGQQVAELVNRELIAGHHQVTFDGSRLPSAIYFYRLESGNHSEVKKMLLIK